MVVTTGILSVVLKVDKVAKQLDGQRDESSVNQRGKFLVDVLVDVWAV
jgi:hypothetical protein